MKIHKTRLITAAAALGTLTGSSTAFTPNSLHSRQCLHQSYSSIASTTCRDITKPYYAIQTLEPNQIRPRLAITTPSTTRLYSSLFNDDDNDDDKPKKKEGILSKIKNKAKRFLPKKWFQSEEEKRSELARKQIRNEISGGLSTLLKDFPMPVRMMGKLVAPMLSSMAAAMGEQTRAIEDLIVDAKYLIARDSYVADALGEPIAAGAPFSQGSSTMSVNGKTMTKVQASFEVRGSVRTGIATMSASGEGKATIDALRVDVGGRSYNVDLSGRGRGGKTSYGRIGKNTNIGKDDVIDAEFVEKK